MNLFGFDLDLNWIMLGIGVLVGWHFPQPAWFGASVDAVKTWYTSWTERK